MKKLLTLISFLSLAFTSATAVAYQDVTPYEAYDLATSDPNTVILDVRTRYEWGFVGHPSFNPKDGMGALLEGKVANVSVMVVSGEDVVPNKYFLDDVKAMLAKNPNLKFITMCRSGKRSRVAAQILEDAGIQVMNMTQGFEGSKDARGYRTVNGWKNTGLPYTAACDGNGYGRYKFDINKAGKLVPPNNGK